MARIQLENVKKKFGKVTALDGVTIDVKDNEFFVLFGPAGAGKTTMLNCIAGITANEEVCRRMVFNSIGLVTALNPYLGYETSSMLAKEALKTGKGIYDLVLEHKLMSEEELHKVLQPENMVHPRKKIGE